MQQVEKLGSLTYEQFVEGYLKPGIPVVLTNASASWPSNTQFTPDFFREHFGSHTTTYQGREYSMTEILALTEQATPENPAPYPMLFEIPEQLPELLPLLNPLHMGYARPNWFRKKFMPYNKLGNNVNLFIGGVGNQYMLHQDAFHTNAWITQLYGRKEFIVFPRGQEAYLYPEGIGCSSPINILQPDYDKYPLYRAATPVRVVVEPGETIFIPNGIWHTTVAVTHNISVILDQLNEYNYPRWREDAYAYSAPNGKLKAAAVYCLANALGTLCQLDEKVRKKQPA